MNLSVTFTANNRPEFFEEVLASWSAVRGKEDAIFYFNCEPFNYENGDRRGTCVDMAEKWVKENKVVGRVYSNSKRFGVLGNPWRALNRAFTNLTIDYTILAEDDLIVSSDILEYHKWAAEHYCDDQEVAMVCSFTRDFPIERYPEIVRRVPGFASVWIWGTWRDRWQNLIKDTWDFDYSTDDGINPGGWDWNLNTRVLLKHGLSSIQPEISRVQNIGAYGHHASYGEQYTQAFGFSADKSPVKYQEF